MRLGKPSLQNLNRYNRLYLHNVEVFLPKSLYIPENFTISLRRFFWLKNLTIDDWKVF